VGAVAARRSGTELVSAAVLFGFGALSSFAAPERFGVVFSITDGKSASLVVIPIVFWSALVGTAAYLAGAGGVPPVRAAATVLAAGFATHTLLALAASLPRVTERGAYSTGFYWFYARLFCGGVLAAAAAWLVRLVMRRLSGYLVLAPALAAGVLAVRFVRADPLFAIAAVATGALAAVGWAAPSGRAAVDLRRWKGEITRERVFVVALFVVALALRLLYTRRVMTNPDYIETGADAVFYDNIAWSLAQGHGIFNPNFPLYILGYARFVALVYRIAGHSYFALCAIQSVIGAVVPVGIYYLAKATSGVTVAAMTGVLSAASFPLVFAAAAIGHQALDVALTLVVVGTLVVAAERPFERWWQWTAVGLVFGLAIAVRETNAIFLLFVYGWLWVFLRRRRARIRPLAAAACLTLGIVLVLTPLVARMVASPEARLALRAHFDRLFSGDLDPEPLRTGLARPMTDPATAWQQLRDRPLFVLATEARVIRHFFAAQFFTQPYGEFDLLLLRKGSAYYFAMFAYAYLFTVIGLAIAGRRVLDGDRLAAALALMIGLLVFRTLPHLVLDSGYRHRVPLEPFLILFCQLGFWTVLSAASRAARPLWSTVPETT
jgi:dolichyl-phosphate-mannose-protein mannosyltransferase